MSYSSTAYCNAKLSIKQATEACVSDISRLFCDNSIKHLIVEAFTTNNPFKEELPKKILEDVTKHINAMAYTKYYKHFDNVYYDEHLNPKADITISDLIDTISNSIDTQALIEKHAILGYFGYRDKKLFVAKRIARTITSNLIFTQPYVSEIAALLPKVEDVYISKGYVFDNKSKTIYKENSVNMTPLKNIRTPHGVVNLDAQKKIVAEYFNISHYSISTQPVSYIILKGVEIVEYEDMLHEIIKHIKHFIRTTDDNKKVLRRKDEIYIAVSEIKTIYQCLISDSFVGMNRKKYTLSAFIKDIGFGEIEQKKVEGKKINMRSVGGLF